MNPVPRSVLAALVGLTFVTGLIDAASVLGLGHVFVANMTGNVVFLGFSLLGRGSVTPSDAILAADSSLTGGANPRSGRRLASVVAMLLGAAVGAWARSVAIAGAALIEAAAVFALVRALRRSVSHAPP
ncbi:MAG: DUF1275 family protein [Pseudomonadota bacterium]